MTMAVCGGKPKARTSAGLDKFQPTQQQSAWTAVPRAEGSDKLPLPVGATSCNS